MNDLVRTDTVFGRRANMIGNISADLVLESLGKIYIKSRNKSQTLEELITSLVITDPNTSTSRTKVVDGIEGLDTSEFKDGTFVFDKSSQILYLFLDNELLELINVAPEGTGYVKRSGDTMTGRLAIYVKNGPPLYVNSADLVENLNAQYLNGETAETFTRRNKDEKIGGKWTFKRPTTFESNTLFYKDIITNGSIGTPNFSSGFGGYGWRMDADTNTLTVDNLVVRKLMQVYELVVNKISATNGSLWVTNAGKVKQAQKLEIKEPSFFSNEYECGKFCGGLQQGDFFIRLNTDIEYIDFSDTSKYKNTREPFMQASGSASTTPRCWTEETFNNAKLIYIRQNGVTERQFITVSEDSKEFSIFPLFDPDFRFNCTFPIVTRSDYQSYKNSVESGQSVDPYTYINYTLPYYKYFQGGDYYAVTFDSDELPVFKPGDLLRCQKWTYGGIKYYDAIVCNYVGSTCIIQLAPSILDQKTTITYDSSLEPQITVQKDNLNETLYKSSSRTPKEPNVNPQKNVDFDEDGNIHYYTYDEQLKRNLLGLVEENDSLVQMGHLWDPQRQNAVYITSTDNGAPFMDVMSGINRPDFSVIYYTPIFETVKLYAKAKSDPHLTGINLTTDVDSIPFTGDYYVQKTPENAEFNYADYTYVKISGTSTSYHLIKGYRKTLSSTNSGEQCEILYYLNLYPDRNTKLISPTQTYDLLLEDGGCIQLEDDTGHLIQEDTKVVLQIASTKTTKARFGNLDGIQDEMFPIDKQPYGYGLYGQNVFLTGEFYLSNGTALADIGKEAITFAMAASDANQNQIELLRQAQDLARDLLSNDIYHKGELETAGMYINSNGIVMWGDKLIIATTEDEFYGRETPTALFTNGKIKAKFLEIHNAYSDEVYQYEDLSQQHKLELSNRKWTEISYSASGTDLSDTSPSTSGGVKIYTYENNGKDVTQYVRLFTIHSLRTNLSDYAVQNNKYNDPTQSEYYVEPESQYDAWLVVNLDGDIPDISNLQYATFLINNIEYSGDSRDPNNIFNVSSEDFDKVLKNVTLWSLRSDGTGNLGGRSVFWNTQGDLSVIGSLNSARGSFAKFQYYKDDMYSLLDPGYAGEYPKFLVHNDKLSSVLQLVEYQSASFDSGYLTQQGYSRLNANQLHIQKGYYDYINLSNNEGVLYEKESITMGVQYPLLNLMVIPYGGNQQKFFVICNYVPQITKIDIYYLFAGTYYIALNCNPAFETFIKDNYLTGNILTCISGINNMYGGLGYFRNESQRVVANLAGLNIRTIFNFGESSSPYVYVGGSENWWYIEAKKKKEVEDSGTSVENIHNISATSLGHKHVKIDNHIIAFKIETINEDKHTEGGFSLQLNYNSFADKIIEYIPPMSNDNYEEDVLLKWIKEPYTSQIENFKQRYIAICGDEDTEGTLHYYIKYMNQAILEYNESASTIQFPVINESSSGLQLQDNVIMDITNEDLRQPNSYIDSLRDAPNGSDKILTVSGKVYDRSVYLYSFLQNDEALQNTEDYEREKTLTGLSPITYIDPVLSSFKSSELDTLQQGAQLLRSFVERECEYIDKYLQFLDKLRFNIQNSKTPDISVSTVYITADRLTGTKSFTVTANSNINWTISTDSKWCFAGVVDSSSGQITSNGSGTQTIEIRYNTNNDYNSRTSIITIKGGDTSVKITFVQEAEVYEGGYTLSVSPSSLSVPASGGTSSVSVTTNSSTWSATSGANWCTTSKSGNTLSISASANTGSRRTTTITITDGNNTAIINVSQSDAGSSDTPLYSVGLLSDIHYATRTGVNRSITTKSDGNNSGSTTGNTYSYYQEDLNYLINNVFQNVDFLASPGDIAEYNINDFIKFTEGYKAAYNNNPKPFYCATGNHDHGLIYCVGNTRAQDSNDNEIGDSTGGRWNSITYGVNTYPCPGSLATTISGLSKSDFYSGSKSYYISYKGDMYIFMMADYGSTNGMSDVHPHNMISSSQITTLKSKISNYTFPDNESNLNFQYYKYEDLIKLEELLRINSSKRIFIFSHYFLPHKAGGGNKYQPGESTELMGITFHFLNYLNNTYTNTIWFSGHTHISWQDNTIKGLHWTNTNYDYIKPTSSDNSSMTYNDGLGLCKISGTNKIYNRNGSNKLNNNPTAWNIHLPSMSRPINTSGKQLGNCEAAIMRVYDDRVEIEKVGYSISNGNSYTQYNVSDPLLTIYNDGTGECNDTAPEISETTSSSDGITFKIKNSLDVEVRLSGKVILNVSKSPTDWTNSTQVNANLHDPQNGDSWDRNDIIIQPGSTYTGIAQSITGIYLPTTDFTDGTWYFMNADNGLYMHSVFLYSRIWNTQKNESSGSNHMYVVSNPPQNTKIQMGITINLIIDWINPEATLQPDNSGHYVILSENNTGL